MNFEHHKLFLSLSLEVLAVVPFRHYPSKSNNANVPISGRPTTAVASNGGRSIWRNRWSHCSFFTNKIISQESVLPCLGTSVALSPCKITVSRAGVSATLSGHQRSTESVHAEPMWSHKWTNWTSRENLWRNEDNETPVDSDGPPNWCVNRHRSFASPTVNQSWTIRKPILTYSLQSRQETIQQLLQQPKPEPTEELRQPKSEPEEPPPKRRRLLFTEQMRTNSWL